MEMANSDIYSCQMHNNSVHILGYQLIRRFYGGVRIPFSRDPVTRWHVFPLCFRIPGKAFQLLNTSLSKHYNIGINFVYDIIEEGVHYLRVNICSNSPIMFIILIDRCSIISHNIQ